MQWGSSLISSYLYNQYILPLNLWVWIPIITKSTRCNIMWHICQQLKTGRWFSSVSPTNKTDRHVIGEILMEMALNTTTLTLLNWSLKNEEEIHFHGTIFYCILFSLQNIPTQLTVNIYRLSVIPTAWNFWCFVYFSSIYSNIQNRKVDLF